MVIISLYYTLNTQTAYQVCPTGYDFADDINACPGTGVCCFAGSKPDCGQGCAQQKCEAADNKHGVWIPKDYCCNAYTCEIRFPLDFNGNSVLEPNRYIYSWSNGKLIMVRREYLLLYYLKSFWKIMVSKKNGFCSNKKF